MKKRILSIVLCVAVILTMLAVATVSVGAEVINLIENGIIYKPDFNSKTLKVIGHDETLGLTEIVIPSEIRGFAVTEIGERAFYVDTVEGSIIESVVISEGVKSLGRSAFSNCTKLKNVTLPQSLISMGDYVFYGCKSLENITIPEKIGYIGGSSFKDCTSLKSVYIPDTVREIQDSAFKNCTSLTNIELPSSASSVSMEAFSGCSSLTSIFIPKNYTSIAEGAFKGCYALDKVTIESDSRLKNIYEYAFASCISLKSIDLPKTVELIEAYAFFDCYNLSKVTLREGIETIGEFAFANCAMTEIELPSSLQKMGYYSVGFLADEEYVYWIKDFTIYGLPGSVAELYADTLDVKFKLGAPVLDSVINTDSGIRVSFNLINNANGYYRVYRKTAGKSWSKLADITTASYTDTTAVAGTKYTYTVKFIGYDGTTSLYDKTGLSITRLKTPSVTKIENVENGAKITWGTVAGATKYRAYVKTSSGWKGLGDTESTSFVHTDAVSGTSYTYTVKAFDSSGASSSFNSTGWSNKFIATPFIKSAEVANSGVKLTWDKVAGAKNYRVFIKNGSSWKGLATVSGTTNNYTDKTATVGNSYTYTIRCVDANGNFVSGYDKEGFTIRYLETPQITSFENVVGGTVISWNEVEGASKYRLYVKKDGSFSKLTDTADTSFVHTDLTDGNEYTYTIRCVSEDSKMPESGFHSTGFSNLYEEPAIKVLTGDADLDGTLSVLDASLIQMFLVGHKTIEGDALIAADADLDGEITILDASLIQMILAGVK